MDTFREPTPEEIKLATLAFMGQHVTGELRELEKNMVSKNRTCTGATLNPVNILRTIPSTGPVSQPVSPISNVVNAGVNIQPQKQDILPPSHPQVVQPPKNELLDIIEILKRIETKLDNLRS